MFELNSKSTIELIKWKEEHDKTCVFTDPKGTEGRFTYCFTPTVLGVKIVVNCICGAEVDVTHREDW
jgi:hypothetical protein